MGLCVCVCVSVCYPDMSSCFMSLYLPPRRVTLSTISTNYPFPPYSLTCFLLSFLASLLHSSSLSAFHCIWSSNINPSFIPSLFSLSLVLQCLDPSCKQLSYLAFLNSLHSCTSTHLHAHAHAHAHAHMHASKHISSMFQREGWISASYTPYLALTYLHPAAPAPLKPAASMIHWPMF